ncbi:MAG: tetratricopeptide repeat protein [Planctomycetaceae bacterium]|nr:tetratricopeptide repeat protein [Planctomycetaceae bacterium]MCB9953144.1 tetratricopeptide repeat protein [Planctomycetaceae bacterium]
MSTDSPPTAPEHHYQHDPERTELEKLLHSGSKSLEPYFNYIIAGVVIVAVVLAGWIYMSRSSNYISTEGWDEFATFETPADFQSLADKHPDAPVANWALLEAGRLYTSEGMAEALTNREASDESLGEAKAAFNKILDKGNAVPAEIREEALFGLANCLEALSGDNTSEAVEAYETLLSEFDNSRHKKWAEARVKELQKEETKDFYVWFREQDPSPADRLLPRDLLPPGHPMLPPPPSDGGSLIPPPPSSDSVPPPPSGTTEEGTKPEPPAEGTEPAAPEEGKEGTPESPASTEEKSEPTTETPETPATETPAAPATETSESPAEPEGGKE